MSCEADARIRSANPIYEIQLGSHIAMQSRNIASFFSYCTCSPLYTNRTNPASDSADVFSFCCRFGNNFICFFFLTLSLLALRKPQIHINSRWICYLLIKMCSVVWGKKHQNQAFTICTEKLSLRQ